MAPRIGSAPGRLGLQVGELLPGSALTGIGTHVGGELIYRGPAASLLVQ